MSKTNIIRSRSPKDINVPPGLKPLHSATNQNETAANADKGGNDSDHECASKNKSDDAWICPADALADFVKNLTGGKTTHTKNVSRRRQLLLRLIDELEQGNHVPTSYIRLALTPDEWREYKADSKARKPYIPDNVRPYFDEYVASLKKADFLNARAENGRNGKQEQGPLVGLRPKRTLQTQAEDAYEKVNQVLSELLEGNRGLVAFLDRQVLFEQIDGTPSPDCSGVARLITSKSEHANNAVQADERWLRINVLRLSLANCS